MINKNTMTNLIRAERTAEKMAQALQEAGVQSDEYMGYYGAIVDLLYELLGEHTNSVEESFTYDLLHSGMSHENCAEVFLNRMAIKGAGAE